MAWYEALNATDVEPSKIGSCVIEGQRIAIYNVDGTYFATKNECTHEKVALSNGILHGCVIECPLHGARFDVRTGDIKAFPAAVKLQTYPVKVEGGKVFVEIE